MTKAEFKSEGLDAIRLYLLAQPKGVCLRQAELARHFSVDRSTIGRWIVSLEATGVPIIWDAQKRVSIDRKRYFTHLSLTRYESTVLMLALRLYQQRQDKHDRHTVEMLQKLGVALRQGIAPTAGEHVLAIAHQQRLQLSDQQPDYQRTLEAISDAWLDGRKVQIRYRSLRGRRAFDEVFHPYIIEPSALSRSTYLIGYSELIGALQIRKIERIERVPLVLDEPFTVAADFDAFKLLGSAWSIWFDADSQPITVQLRFSGEDAVRRMLEERWHLSERKERDAEGRLLWSAEIDEPQEMLPWIRGWGADCEVLAPIELREKVSGEVRRQVQVYGIGEIRSASAALVAHTPPPGTNDWHLLVDHLTRVAELARDFAEPFGAGPLAYQLGLWHDVGKSNPAFQTYLRRCHNDPIFKGHGPDHKAAGAALAEQHMPTLALLVQGHHGGLRTSTDCKTWLDTRQSEDSAVIPAAITQMRQLLPTLDPSGKLPTPAYLRDQRSFEFFLRMLFSTLVDADFLDTEQHFQRAKASLRDSDVTLAELLVRFEASQAALIGHSDTLVGQARTTLYQACIAAAEQPPGLFRLAIPTGGGKTRSAMAFALRHALKHGQKRVIVAVPFISITEQTADVYRGIFHAGEDDRVVLEHHSGDSRQSEEQDYSPHERWKRLAAENWDAPIVVTTTVQLFESLFANQTGRCRKLHRLAGSVIILDEVQALPPQLLTPILDGLRQLCANYGTTVVLSTATQPAFESIPAFADLSAREIVPDAAHWFAALKRVSYDWRVRSPLSWSEVAALMGGAPQALAVVNTKKDALALLDALGDPEVLHLSTLLCGAHRRAVINTVKERLKSGMPCRLVSTQVIEAGVDLDFPLVLRAMGPLDRVIQAAGRCNREGKLAGLGQVIVFDPAEGGLPPGSYKTATNITRAMIGNGALDPDNPEEVRRYFNQIFGTLNLDPHKIQQLREGRDYPQVAEKFRMIEDDTESVIITSYGSAAEQAWVQVTIGALQAEPTSARQLLRRLQPYMVALRSDVARRYRTAGLIADLLPDVGIWNGVYDNIRGLVPDDDRSLMII